jgi:alpha-galactosidase
MSAKITMIGAGSVVFAKNLLGDILQFPELADVTISLMDLDPARLKVAEIMARKIVEKLKVPARIEATLDQREAVRGANYAICTVQVGGYRPGTVIDFEIPKKYGLQQTIADTLGVGGVFRALRTIPVINRLAQDMAEVGAPNALLLNYTNPMAMNCWAVDRAVGLPHVGLCHSVQGTSHQLARYAGLPYEDITYLVAGINHMAFFLKYEYRRQDAYPLLFKLLEDKHFKSDKVRFEMMRRTGYFVTESSEHQSEYVPYFIHHGKEMIAKFDIPIDEYLRRCEGVIATWKETEAELLGRDGEIKIGKRSHEYGSLIIHSRETNLPRVIYGNVPNRGLITNLPEGCCVEVPCLVDGQGVQPTRIGALPPQLAALCQTNINVQALTVEAALTKKREHIYHAVMLDPHTSTVLPLDKIWAMCDELIEAHQKEGLLGEFAPVIQGTGRGWAGTGDRVTAWIEMAPESTAVNGLRCAEVHVQNPRSEPVEIPLTVDSLAESGERLGTAKILVKVPARQIVISKVELPGRSGSEGFTLALTTAASSVLTKNLMVRPRKQIQGKTGTVDYALELSGVPAMSGRLENRGKDLRMRFEVADSQVKPMSPPWTGSSLELFFSPKEGARLRQFFVVPGAGGPPKVLNNQEEEMTEWKISQKAAGAGYELDLMVPKASLDLPEGSTDFLFDCYARVTALGEAHGGGWTSLSGGNDSHLTSRNYARVQLQS